MKTVPEQQARYLLFAWITVVLVFVHWQFREAPNLALRMTEHRIVVDGTAFAPARYRILGPFTAEAVLRVLRPLLGEIRAFHLVYLAWNVVWGTLTLVMVDRFLRLWHGSRSAFTGTLLYAFVAVIGFAESFYTPWSVAEIPLLLAGIMAFLAGRSALALAVVAVASLNRETAVLIPIAWAALSAPAIDRFGGMGRRLAGRDVTVGLGFAVWGAVYGSIRLLVGPEHDAGPPPPWATFGSLLRFNLEPAMARWAALMIVLWLGPLCFFWVRGFRRADPLLRRLSLLALPMAVLFFKYAYWREVRVLMPLAPIEVAVALYALVPEPTEA